MKSKIIVLCILSALFLPTGEINAQLFGKKKKEETEKKEDSKKDDKGYSEIITSEAESDEGLFTVHKVDDKWYFEIPDSLLNREILNVSRIAGIIEGFSFGGAGMKAGGQKVFRFEKHEDNLLLRYVSYSSVADEDDPIYKSVRNNNFEPIIEKFEIETMTPDSSAYVIDVSSFFTSDVAVISPINERNKQQFGIRNLDKDRSLIEGAKSFPMNTEVQHVLTYNATSLPSNRSTGTLSLKMNQSFVLLPEEPMQPRIYDRRVAYFSVSQRDYSLDEQKAGTRRYITRWRLEPSDLEAFSRGELVEPVKPIVYYIDPATPEKWREYIKKGVEDWQVAFEEAGFRNAIIAMDPPSEEEDPDWSPEDIRYSVIRYISTDIQNAQGPHVHDPRSGEIIESDILWYHNVMNLLRNWYFIQTAAVNPEARGVKFRDEIMGELIRFVAAHEVGHTLGLPHNMGSSWAYPVDSLRSPTFTATHGTAPSIMDYARFNYVAQPGDDVTNLMPAIGEYDKFSILWGYRPIPSAENAAEEQETLHEWILQHGDSAEYRFGFRDGIDPSAQTEDLGDNSVKASEYGLANLRRIIPNLIEWTEEEGKDYDDLDELYNNVTSQFRRYIGHVVTNIGGVYTYNKTYDQDGAVHTHVEEERQREAVIFLNNHVFDTPEWLLDNDILSRINKDEVMDDIQRIQVTGLNRALSEDRLKRMVENEALNGSDAYTIAELYDDLRNGIWSELGRATAIDPFRRNLQRGHVMQLGELMKSTTDVGAVSRAELLRIQQQAANAARRTSDDMSRYHLQDIVARIDRIMEADS